MKGPEIALTAAAGVLACLACLACSKEHLPSRFPTQPPGCPVEVSEGAPAVPMDNIGTVSAHCGSTVGEQDCMRTLQDQVCKIGGDLVWGVTKDTAFDGATMLAGRAVKKR